MIPLTVKYTPRNQIMTIKLVQVLYPTIKLKTDESPALCEGDFGGVAGSIPNVGIGNTGGEVGSVPNTEQVIDTTFATCIHVSVPTNGLGDVADVTPTPNNQQTSPTDSPTAPSTTAPSDGK